MEIDGTILNYGVTKDSVHNAKEASELIMRLLADVGYVGKKLIHQFKQKGHFYGHHIV